MVEPEVWNFLRVELNERNIELRETEEKRKKCEKTS